MPHSPRTASPQPAATQSRDGNFRYALWGSISEKVALSRPAGLQPTTVRAFLEANRPRFLSLLDPLAPRYVVPRPQLPSTARSREEANIEALRILAAGTKRASRAQVLALLKYTGFGGLDIERNVSKFPKGFEPDSYSLLHEFYTPFHLADEVVRVLAPFLEDVADAQGRIRALEPSAGIGRFIDAANRGLPRVSLLWTAIELSAPAAGICTLLNPSAVVHNESYERFNGARVGNERWELVLCNPPFGSSTSTRVFADEDPDPEYNEPYDFAYFLRRGLDSLALGGIAAFIVQQSFLTGAANHKLRETILRRHHLMTAYRLPSEDSEGKPFFAGQRVVTDILFFRSRGGTLREIPERDEYVVAGEYFAKHPDHILGEQTTPKFRGYAVVADSLRLPDIVERVDCAECAVIEIADKRSVIRRESAVHGREEPITEDDPIVAAALRLGRRVDRYLARLAQGDDVRLLWQELLSALTDFRATVGNPWSHDEIQRRYRANDHDAQSLARAFDPSGELVDALRSPPRFEATYAGRSDDVAHQARWLFRLQGTLSVGELLEFHQRVGGIEIDAEDLARKLLATGEWFRDGDEWQGLVPEHEYLYGDLWPRYDACAKRPNDLQAQLQAARLLEKIDPARFDEIEDLGPNQAWLPLSVRSAWLSTINGGHGAPRLLLRDGILTAERTSTVSSEVIWFIGWCNHYKTLFQPDPIEDWRVIEGLDLGDAITELIDKAQAQGDKEDVDIRRIVYEKKWTRDFREFVAQRADLRQQIEEVYNRRFRGFVAKPVDTSPISIERWTDDPSVALKPHQIAAVRQRAATRGGVMGMEVGVGKTMGSLGVVALGRQEGWIRRPAIVVPSGLVWQWRDEIERMLPDYAVVVIGRKRRTVSKGDREGHEVSLTDTPEERARKWTDFQAGLYDVALVSGSMLGRTKIHEDDVARYAAARTSIMRSVRLRQDVARRKKRNKGKLSARQEALLENGALAWVRETLKQEDRDFDPGIVWGDLGIDFLVIDEAGYYRNTFSPTTREFGVPKYMGSTGEGSLRAWQADLRASVVRERTGGNGVLALTGTLGENSPLEVYNIFHLVNPKIFEGVGIPDPEQWIDRYLSIEPRMVPSIHGPREPALVVSGFKNLRELRGILFRWGTFTSAREAGLKIPKSEECLVTVQMDDAQKTRYDSYRSVARKALSEGRIGTAFAAISRMRLITIHPELEDGYTWETAQGGLALKEVSQRALGAWVKRGWILRTKAIAEEEASESDALRKRQLQLDLKKLEAAEERKGTVKIQRSLPPPDDVSSPKLLAVAQRIMRTPDCGHIVFVDYTAVHNWLTEVLVGMGMPRERIAVVNGKTKVDINDIAEKFNGDDESPPSLTVIIANSTAYRGANLQRLTCAIHNLSLTWTPADLEQRRGRGQRQGNLLPKIRIWFYFAEWSFDPFMFSLLTGKATWQDELYRGDSDRSINPAAQLDLSPAQLRRMTASSPEEADRLEAELRDQEQARELEAGRIGARKVFLQAAARFAEARAEANTDKRAALERQGEERIATLLKLSPEVWPWRSVTGRVRSSFPFVPRGLDAMPLFEGDRVLIAGVASQCGRVLRSRKSIAVRRARSFRWELHDLENLNDVAPLRADQWPADDDEVSEAGLVTALASDKPPTWVELGWRFAENGWIHRYWERHGASVVDRLAKDGLPPLPVLVDDVLEIRKGEEASEVKGLVIPPTERGWLVYLDFQDTSPASPHALKRSGWLWFGRSVEDDRVALTSVERVPQPRAARPIDCPGDVERLRPPEVLEYLDRIWEELDIRPDSKGIETDVELSGGGFTIPVHVAVERKPTKAAFVVAAINAVYRDYAGLVADLFALENDLIEHYTRAKWAGVNLARSAVAERMQAIRAILGDEAAATIDYCARTGLGSRPQARVERLAREAIAPHLKPGWRDNPSLQRLMRADAERLLVAAGFAGEEAGKATESAIQEARQAAERSAEGVKAGDNASVRVTALPERVQQALRDVGYRRSTVRMTATENADLRVSGGRGYQGIAAVVRLDSSTPPEIHYGSWGGPNPFSKAPVDTGERVTLSDVVVLVKGYSGGGRPTSAWIEVTPARFARLRPSHEGIEVSPGGRLALVTILAYKAGYRARAFSREDLGVYGQDNPFLRELIDAGLVKIVGQQIRVTELGQEYGSTLRETATRRAFEEAKRAV